MNIIKEHYSNITIFDLITKFNYKNIFLIPKIMKIDINIGFKYFNSKPKKISTFFLLMEIFSNQKPKKTLSKKNILILNIRKGDICGCKTTLRGDIMFIFLNKFFILMLPLDKEFKGFLFKRINNNICFSLSNILNILEIKNDYIRYNNIPKIDIILHTDTKDFFQLKTLLSSFNNNLIKN